jgi:signal peptidase II
MTNVKHEADTRQKLLPFLLMLAILVVDQLTKAWIVSRWPGDGVFIADVFGNDFLWIIHVRNKAIAFSIGHGLPDGLRSLLFILLPLGVLGALIVYYLRTDEFSAFQRWAVCGILGGGFGNLIDRIFRPDGVVDFISVNFYGLLGLSRWPTFNVADSSVVVCGALLFVSVFFASGVEREGEKA